MVSMHSGKPICTPSCLSETVPNAALETRYFTISALVPVFHLEGLFEKNQLSVHWYALACEKNKAASLQALHIKYHRDILICQSIWAISSHKPSMVFHQTFHHISKRDSLVSGWFTCWVAYILLLMGGWFTCRLVYILSLASGWFTCRVVYTLLLMSGWFTCSLRWLVYMLSWVIGLHVVFGEWMVYM